MAGFGVLLAVFDTRLMPAFSAATSRALWGSDVMPADTVPYHRFVHGVLGATIVGFATTVAFLARYPLARREGWAWNAIAAAFAGWFTIDTAASVAAGVWPNVLLNVMSLAPFGLGLAMTKRGLVDSGQR